MGYNISNNRFGVLSKDLWEIEGLHCGESIYVFINKDWIKTRIEYDIYSKHSHGWYIVELPMQTLEHLQIRLNKTNC